MRKFRFLGIVAAALVVIALPAMAGTTLGASGEVTYGIIGNGTTAADGWVNAYMNLNATIDANNTVVLGLQDTNMPTVLGKATALTTAGNTGQAVPPLDVNFYLKSDIAGDLGLDAKTIDPVLYGGYGVFDLPDYNVTQYGTEGIAAMGVDNGYADGIFGAEIGAGYGMIALNTTVLNMVNIMAGVAGTAFTAPSATNKPQAMVGAYTTIGPIQAEAGWAMQGTTSGFIPIGLKFNYTMGSVALAAMGQYVVNANTNGVSNWAAGAAVTYASNYTIDYAVLSYEPGYEPTVAALKGTGDIIVNITPTLGVIGSVFMNFDPNAAAAFDTFEASAWAKFGAAKVRLGYFYDSTGLHNLGGPVLNAPGDNALNGGIFLTTDLTF